MLDGETWEGNEYGMESFGALDSSEKRVAILRDEWCSQTAKQERDTVSYIKV